VDLDAFYASVETQKDPTLAGRPVVVAGAGNRGVVLSASYEARAFGVESAMPAMRARRLAPGAAFVPPDFEAYRTYSNRFREILLAHTPLVEPMSLDEAFLDVGGAVRLFGDPPRIAARIRRQVQENLGITCSVGVAPTKFVAKLASTRAKPDGLLVVTADSVHAFLDPLPIAALWGAGERTVDTLSRLGVRTVGELAALPTTVLARVLGEAHARTLSELARGVDERQVVPYEAPKSVSHEETFDRDLDDDEEILRELLSLSGRVGARLREEGYMARTVVIKVRLANFTTLHRSRTLPEATDVAARIYHVAAELYRALPGGHRRIRLLGVGASGLHQAGAQQLALYRGERWSDLERTMDRIERRFGRGATVPAALLDRPRSRRVVRPAPSDGSKPRDPDPGSAQGVAKGLQS
jgi:DNA polymerase-4